MRLPHEIDDSSEGESPEVDRTWGENYDSDNENIPPLVSSLSRRRILRGEMVDIRDDDGNWYSAEIKKIDRHEKKIFVSFPTMDATWDKWIEISGHTAPHNTYTYDGRGNFKIGQIVEAQDDRGQWRGATVLEVEERRGATLVRVEFHLGTINDDEWIRSPINRIRSFRRPRVNMQEKKDYRQWKVPRSDPSPGPAANHVANNPCTSYTPSNENHTRQIAATSDRYAHYTGALGRQDLFVVPVIGDGNCLFRAVAHQVYGDEELHHIVRDRCMSYMEADAAFFSQFVEGGAETFPQYLHYKRLNGCWGDDPEIQALCEIYDRPAEIWAYDASLGARKLRTFHEAASNHSGDRPSGGSGGSFRPTMKLSFYGGGHYDSIADRVHRVNIMSSPPGAVEDAAVARVVRYRDLGGLHALSGSGRGGSDLTCTPHRPTLTSLSSSFSSPLEEAKILSDAEATERSALDMAIRVSRAEHMDWASEDLETCLLMALGGGKKHQGGAGGSASIGSSGTGAGMASTSGAGNGVVADGRLMDMDEATRVALVADPLLVEEAADIAAAQRDLLQSVAAQSDREDMERAILSSLASQHDSHMTDDEMLEQAKAASIQDFGLGPGMRRVADVGASGLGLGAQADEDEELKRVLALSAQEDDQALKRALEASATEAPFYGLGLDLGHSGTMGGRGHFGPTLELDEEDALLQAAMAESLMSHPPATTSSYFTANHSPSSSSSSRSSSYQSEAKGTSQWRDAKGTSKASKDEKWTKDSDSLVNSNSNTAHGSHSEGKDEATRASTSRPGSGRGQGELQAFGLADFAVDQDEDEDEQLRLAIAASLHSFK